MTTLTFDADKLTGSDKKTVLDAILKTRKHITVIHGPAGSGKTTFAASQTDGFVASLQDVKRAKSFVVISSAGRTKKAIVSARVEHIVKRANVVKLFIVSSDTISQRRWKRVESGSDDARTPKQLRGTLRAPMNQFDVVAHIRKIAKKSEIVLA